MRVLVLCAFVLTALNSVASAKGDPEQALSSVRTLVTKLEEINGRINQLVQDLDNKSKKIGDLETEKARALQELKSGLYCSQCGRTKTEIERGGGETFEQHLVSVSGRAIPATKAQLDKKTAEYDGRINSLKSEQLNIAREKDRIEIERREIETKRLPESVLLWRDAIVAEETRLSSQWELANKDLAADQEALAGRYKDATMMSKSGLRLEYQQLERKRDELRFDFGLNMAELQRQKTNGLNELARSLSKANAPFLVPPTWLLGIPPVPIQATPFKLAIGFDRIVATASFGSVHAGLEIENDWFRNTMSVKAGLEVMGIAIGMEQKTLWGVNGVTTGEQPFFKPGILGRP